MFVVPANESTCASPEAPSFVADVAGLRAFVVALCVHNACLRAIVKFFRFSAMCMIVVNVRSHTSTISLKGDLWDRVEGGLGFMVVAPSISSPSQEDEGFKVGG